MADTVRAKRLLEITAGPGLHAHGVFLDDLHVVGEAETDVERAYVITLVWPRGLGIQLRAGKSWALGSAQLRTSGGLIPTKRSAAIRGEELGSEVAKHSTLSDHCGHHRCDAG